MSAPNSKPINIKTAIISHYEMKFREIMELDNLMPSDFIDSLNVDANQERVFKAGEGSG